MDRLEWHHDHMPTKNGRYLVAIKDKQLKMKFYATLDFAEDLNDFIDGVHHPGWFVALSDGFYETLTDEEETEYYWSELPEEFPIL